MVLRDPKKEKGNNSIILNKPRGPGAGRGGGGREGRRRRGRSGVELRGRGGGGGMTSGVSESPLSRGQLRGCEYPCNGGD